jgi:NAD(P)-dependent dehydrogenase (short-subunit alcohol dehydrogenase family)
VREIVAVVGAGPGLGVAVARRFAAEGAAVALVARDAGRLGVQAEPLGALPVPADVSDVESLRAAFHVVRTTFGDPTVLVFNVGTTLVGPPSTLPYEAFRTAMVVGPAGLLASVQEVLPAMRAAGRGTILVTGSGQALHPMAEFGAVGPQKAAVRALTLALAEEAEPDGVHVVTVTIRGGIQAGTFFDPARIADCFWELHTQPRGSWRGEHVYAQP